MNRIHSSVYAATVKFHSIKGCFVYVSKAWLKKEDIHLFKIIHSNGTEVLVSCLPSSVHDGIHSEVFIHSKFAEKLNLKENDKICLQPAVRTPSRATQLVLEPLTSDDWEILELNAKFLEGNLMNQIRVVSMYQVFPVWISNSHIYVKVVDSLPSSQPILLAEFTEVSIVPKGRMSEKLTPEANNSKKKTQNHLQFQHLRCSVRKSTPSPRNAETKDADTTDSSSQDSQSKISSLISYLFPATSEEKNLSLSDSYENFIPISIDFTLRVTPYSRRHARPLPVIVQATTVFISASTYVKLYGSDDIPPCFVAVLTKSSATENTREKSLQQQDKANTDASSRASTSSSKSWGGTRESKSFSSVLNEERQRTFDSVCVTVMVIRSAEEDEFDLPKCLFYSENAVVVPLELKKCLNLEVASLVHVKGIQSKPTMLNTLAFHPVTSMPTSITAEIVLTNFRNWAFGEERQASSFIISDGTFVSLRLFGQKYDFFISIKENNQTLNSSISSFTSTSPISTNGEQKTVSTGEPKYGYLDSENINELSAVLGNAMSVSILIDRPYLQKPSSLYQDIPVLQLDGLGGVNELTEQALESLEFWLKLRPSAYITNHPFTFSGCMLLCGPKGVGKSSFAKAICKKLARFPSLVHIKIIECLPLRGKRSEMISKKWNEILLEASNKQPSIILFEDLDSIASCPATHEQEVGADGVYFSNLARSFIHIMKKVANSASKLAVIVTSQSTHSLHPSLTNTKGRHIFQSVIEVRPPNAEQRQEILKSLVYSKPHISRRTVENIQWDEFSFKTEGYVAQDLGCLVDRATHAAWVRMANAAHSKEIILNQDDFEMALEGYVPSSLRGIQLQVHDHKTWSDVGGLKEVKKIIQQIIMWPVKYKQIFKNYSLKPQTNILLYGAPGTGKTLLAGVIANECGLNFISIKGPELLSKYIGASEESIRDLFKRATAAKPCILFFDEFDSIAPRRGHDSTGVTDRVVNQLLTQLDGVESLEGVHVIAASSRPELIDPALLRPGRLDKCLLCPLPNESERLEILQCLSSKLTVSEDIDLQFIASETEHYSGADLQALLYTANIEALHDIQTNKRRRYSTGSADKTYAIASNKVLYMPTIQDGLNVPSYEDGKKIIQEVDVIKENFSGIMQQTGARRLSTINIIVGQKHLLKVLSDMKPSVSPQERLRYEAVFKNFQNGVVADPVSSLAKSIKRVTLA